MSVAAVLAALNLQTPSVAPDLSWLAGYWLSCDAGREVSETWSDPRGGVLSNMTATVEAGRGAIEFGRIAPQGNGLAFFAQPDGQPPAIFPLTDAEDGRAVFANPGHDFPQRILYRREGDSLIARIEGEAGGATQAVEWRYRAAPLNARCPA